MDPNGDEEERALREHIRNILYEYAVTHLTTDYVQFTEDAVSEVKVILTVSMRWS